MDDNKKIVLGSEDFFVKKVEDIFININLQQKFNIIKKERFDNNFDLSEQFIKERNTSRSFRVYGIIDSTIVNCDNLKIKVYSQSVFSGGSQLLSGHIATVNTQSIGFGDKNIFGKMRGKYIIELDNYKISDTIWIEILGNGVNYSKTIIEQKLVFKDTDENFVEYGTNTVDIGINGGFEIIQNDFPFFYNKHWVKNNFQIEKVNLRNIKFTKSSYNLNEGDSGIITVELSEPSVFGTEAVTITLTSPIIETYNTAAIGKDFSVNTIPFTFPMNLNWNIGEKVKDINISAISDGIIEKFEEDFTLSLENPKNATINNGVVNVEKTVMSIKDFTPKYFVTFNLQKIINNINPVTNPTIFPENLGQLLGYQMNNYGAGVGVGPLSGVNNNFRFFPNDTFELIITNEGDSTTLPVIPGVTTQEQFFGPGDSFTISAETKYINHDTLPREVAVFNFKEKNIGNFISLSDFYVDSFFINGLEFDRGALVADDFVKKIAQKYSALSINPPFTVSQNTSSVTLTANHPAYNINGLIPKKPSTSLFGLAEYALQSSSEIPDYPNGRVSSITSQIPYELKLYGNFNNSTDCKYSFKIKKIGFKDVIIPFSTLPASTSGSTVYLVTPIRDVSGPSLPPNDFLVCDPSTNLIDVNGYYLNGVALLASALFDSSESTATNTHSSGYLPTFKTKPLTTDLITCNNLIDISKVLS